MQKSVFTFGLLASSLVMLAIMPFLNSNNSFSNPIMAQEYDKYRDSSYSQYPTDDNKYQCRTGPFEGFFVSSVEFCKHIKFDDRKDHSIDNKTGAQGPQGPPGITQLNDTNTYSVTSGEIVNTFNSSTVGVASCNSGDFVINGGFTITGTSPSPAGVTLFEDWNKPFYTPVTSGWEVFIFPYYIIRKGNIFSSCNLF